MPQRPKREKQPDRDEAAAGSTGRQADGTFAPGNDFSPGGSRAGAGRKPNEIRQFRQSLAIHVPAAIRKIQSLMDCGQPEVELAAARWCCEQVLGKAAQGRYDASEQMGLMSQERREWIVAVMTENKLAHLLPPAWGKASIGNAGK